MEIRRFLGLTLSVLFTLSTLSGCTQQDKEIVDNGIEYITAEFKKVVRNSPDFSAGKRGTSLAGKSNVEAGESLTFTAQNNTINAPFIYYLFDFGDGCQTIMGPYNKKTAGQVQYTYKVPGTYKVYVKSISLSTFENPGWSAPFNVKVLGEAQNTDYIIPSKAICSVGNAKALADNNSETVWKCDSDSEWAGLLLYKNCRINTLEIDTVKGGNFPSDFVIQYSTDRGKIWYPVPIYDYNRTGFYMKFPNPDGSRLVLQLNGLAANAIRILSNDGMFDISDLRVTGDRNFLFETSQSDTYNADLNNMWNVFGSAVNEPRTAGSQWYPSDPPFKGGVAGYGVTEWQEWTGLKLNWYNDAKNRQSHRNSLLNTKVDVDGQGNDGYVWPSAGDPKHLGIHRKYSTNPTFIIAVRNYLLSGNDSKDFLNTKDSNAETMMEKVERALKFMLETEKGTEGLLTITDPEHDGTAKGGPSTYWDNVTCFGYKSAYENALFYSSLNAMADIYIFRNDLDKAKEMTDLAAKVKENYNNLFWDEQKGRYIGSIDINGDKHDFGFTYVNFMAISYGLADEAKSKKILDWIDGKHIIKGETSTGADIYAFKYAPRSNTVAFESKEPYHWFDWNKAIWPGPDGPASYGKHLENGGVIFYVSYYDLMSRIKAKGADNADKRFDAIMKEFHVDTLRRNQINDKGADWVEGIIGPFPESGLVPSFFVHGFMGIDMNNEGMSITPRLPKDWSKAAVNEVSYGGKLFRVEASRDIKSATTTKEGDKIIVKVPVDKTTIIKLDGSIK